MSARLQINCGPGRKETVQVNPNTTMGYVLDEVCKRRKLNSAEHALKHHDAGQEDQGHAQPRSTKKKAH